MFEDDVRRKILLTPVKDKDKANRNKTDVGSASEHESATAAQKRHEDAIIEAQKRHQELEVVVRQLINDKGHLSQKCQELEEIVSQLHAHKAQMIKDLRQSKIKSLFAKVDVEGSKQVLARFSEVADSVVTHSISGVQQEIIEMPTFEAECRALQDENTKLQAKILEMSVEHKKDLEEKTIKFEGLRVECRTLQDENTKLQAKILEMSVAQREEIKKQEDSVQLQMENNLAVHIDVKAIDKHLGHLDDHKDKLSTSESEVGALGKHREERKAPEDEADVAGHIDDHKKTPEKHTHRIQRENLEKMNKTKAEHNVEMKRLHDAEAKVEKLTRQLTRHIDDHKEAMAAHREELSQKEILLVGKESELQQQRLIEKELIVAFQNKVCQTNALLKANEEELEELKKQTKDQNLLISEQNLLISVLKSKIVEEDAQLEAKDIELLGHKKLMIKDRRQSEIKSLSVKVDVEGSKQIITSLSESISPVITDSGGVQQEIIEIEAENRALKDDNAKLQAKILEMSRRRRIENVLTSELQSKIVEKDAQSEGKDSELQQYEALKQRYDIRIAEAVPNSIICSDLQESQKNSDTSSHVTSEDELHLPPLYEAHFDEVGKKCAFPFQNKVCEDDNMLSQLIQAKIDSANAFTDLDAIKRENVNLAHAAAGYEKEIRSLKSQLARKNMEIQELHDNNPFGGAFTALNAATAFSMFNLPKSQRTPKSPSPKSP